MRVNVRTEPVNQAFVASLELPLLEQGLALRSDWTDARPVDHRWVIEGVTPGTDVVADIAGRQLTGTADEQGTAVLAWDGLDANGTPAGPAVATAEVGGTTRRMKLGRWDARAFGLGALLLGGYDHLDVVSRRIHLGTGRTKSGIAAHPTGDGWRVPRAEGRQQAAFDGDGFLTRVTETASGRVLVACERAENGLRSFTRTGGTLTVAPTDDGLLVEVANRRLQVALGDDGRVVRLRGPGGGDLTVGWEAGLLTAITDADGFSHRFDYDDDGRLVTFTRPGRGPTRLVRTTTEHGRRVLVLTAGGRESSYQVEVLPDGTRVRTTRCCGRPPRVTRIDGADLDVEVGDGTHVHTDRSTGQRRVVLPSGLTRERISSTDGVTVNGRTWQWASEPDATTATSPEGRVKGIWVQDGEVTMLRQGQRTTLKRDEHGRVSQVAQGETTWQVEHDDAGLVTRVQGSDGAVTTMEHDAAGWLLAQVLPGGRHIGIDRTGGGRVLGLTSPGGGTTSMTLAAPDLLESISFPDVDGRDQDVLRLERDADGTLVGYQEGTAPAVALVHDASGLLTETRVGDQRLTSHTYAHGRPVRAATRDGQVTSMAWDGPLLTSIAQEGIVSGSVHRRHDADLQVDAVACGQLNAAVRRDRDGLVTGLGPATLERDGAGRVVAVRAGVVAQTWEHDEHGRLRATQVDVHGQTGWRVDYERDPRGRITRLTDSRVPGGQPSEFTYDDAGHLVSATGPFPFTATWDANANPVSWQHGDTPHEAAIAADDRLLTLDGEPLEHDGAGRVRMIPGGVRLAHDPRGRLTTVDRPAQDGTTTTTTLTRDAFGHVIMLATDGHDPLRLLPGPYGHPEAVVAEDGSPRMLLVGGTAVDPPVLAVEAGRTLLLACDHLGTVRLVIDVTSGELVDERVHDHWGRLVRRSGSSEVPFGWGGGLLDTATGLVHFPARSHSPDLLRFLSRDPLLFRGRSTNLFAFADGDPVNHRDPTGTTRICRSGWYRWQVPGTDVGETWEHWWIEDKNGNEAGWGPENDSNYNESGSGPGEFGEVRDHGNRSENDGVECDEVEDVDDECVAREMAARMGDKLGFWGPGNTCQSWVDDVLNTCSDGDYTVETDNPDAYENVYGPNPDTTPKDGGSSTGSGGDGGYTPVDGEYTPADGGSLWE